MRPTAGPGQGLDRPRADPAQANHANMRLAQPLQRGGAKQAAYPAESPFKRVHSRKVIPTLPPDAKPFVQSQDRRGAETEWWSLQHAERPGPLGRAQISLWTSTGPHTPLPPHPGPPLPLT